MSGRNDSEWIVGNPYLARLGKSSPLLGANLFDTAKIFGWLFVRLRSEDLGLMGCAL